MLKKYCKPVGIVMSTKWRT